MAEVGLTDAVAGLRRELARAVLEAEGAAVQFPVGQVTLQFQVGVTKTGEGSADVRFWVLELGASSQYSRESVQTITIVLGPPVNAEGKPIKVSSALSEKPG